ncbi:MAG: hypothetical protein QOD94_3209 [Alphaproteobacteria bacterium]|jgi:tetratricopeptide (TPR) repeat protein|nr:hypothetical protein [Alphaproteobacteria bacterium]
MLTLRRTRGRTPAMAACALLFGFGGCLSAGESIAQTVTPSGPAVKRLCREISDAKPRVLLGRFSLFGEFEPNLRHTLNQVFVNNLEWGLLQQPEVSVFGSKSDSIDLQRFRDLPDLIDNAFNISVTATQSTQGRAVDPHGQALLAALKANNCEYLFGGRISKEGALINVEPYLLNVQSGEISRPFAPSTGDAQSLLKIAEHFTRELSSYLRERHWPDLRGRFVEVTCFAWTDTLPLIIRSSADVFSELMRRYVLQALAADKKFSVRPSAGQPSSCEPSAPEKDREVAAVVTGEITLRDLMSMELRPSVRLVAQSYSVALAPVTYAFSSPPSSLITKLPMEFAVQVRAFLVAVTRRDGSFPEPDVVAATDLESIVSSLGRGTVDERAAIAAYAELSRNRQDSRAHWILARVFQTKQETELALQHFLKAKDGEKSLPLSARAELNEGLGEFTKEPAERTKYFLAAKELHREAQDESGVRRAGRGLAIAMYLGGQKKEAVAELQQQADLERDSESLRLLGWFLSLSEQEADAIPWLSKALLANPRDGEARSLLADAYERLGRKALVANQFIAAREDFGLASSYRESGHLFYLAGLSAYELGDLRDAATLFERMVRLPSDKSTLKMAEASWLTLLECYLLLGDYAAVERRGQDASSFLRWLPDSRLLAAYLRLIGRVVADPQADITTIKKEPAYREIESVPSEASAKNLRWTNNKVAEYLAKKVSDPEKTKFVAELAQRVWRDSKALQ